MGCGLPDPPAWQREGALLPFWVRFCSPAPLGHRSACGGAGWGGVGWGCPAWFHRARDCRCGWGLRAWLGVR